ncbi:hypothetical protein [Psychrobacillus lasiicapitis]|uniref:Uncharacterized protein n=1 Tax=Psychrobacillus lasiicapitis TaxID=1636719 RepID=A0A544T1V7_9BACI|nr:hypothetical protein [Psychrobacillus lasiicapitis]TQR11432.1 hypothetical protein FG382_15930 [Psychrobacillus lasiicapitis]GGA40589.1 hypothetical protein GCM10011384_32790 [Psychrobacillus lasiicapitis]
MPDKKVNKLKIKSDYYTDLAFTERKINIAEFERKHKWGNNEKWEEMKYIASTPFFLHSFLTSLNVEQRLRAVKDLYGYSFKELKGLGKFGGSVHKFFKNQQGYTGDKMLTEQRARLAITLDIPIIYILKDKPTFIQREQYNYLEYHEIAKTITFSELNNILVRPIQREISAYKIEINKDNPFYCGSALSQINCRVDLHKTFFSIEFYLHSRLDVDLYSINRIVEKFDYKIFRIIISTALLRDTYKLSLICTYIEEQKEDAKNFSEKLIRINNGTVLFPYNYDFEKVVPF